MPEKVLDIGTGTGCWAIDFAERYPGAEVVGNDLSPIQPGWVWPNLRFEVDDVELEWAYQDEEFDYIHVRCMSACIDDWGFLLRETFRCMKPGGFVEFQDYSGEIGCDDATLPEGSALVEWFRVFQLATGRSGRSAVVAAGMKVAMEEAGFVDVVERKMKWPVGPWAADKKRREIGRWTVPALAESLSPFAVALFTRVLGWRREEVDDLVERAVGELRSGRGGPGECVHFYSHV